MRPVALAYVNRGRWMTDCPWRDVGRGCEGADHACDRFVCRLCFNRGTLRPVPVVWPSDQDILAIEAALAPRPLRAQNWEPNESIGYLLAENVEHGLYNPLTGEVFGDVGADQNRLPGYLALAGAVLELGP